MSQQQIGEILGDIRRRGGGESGLLKKAETLKICQEIFHRLTEHPCQPANLQNGILTVHVDNSISAQELAFQRSSLIQQINDKLGSGKIEDIKIKMVEFIEEYAENS